MVVPLKLTQFYGHSVPRPRIYADVKLNDQRIDPPPSVNEALLSWASDAHWSMGGLSFKRFRAQGKVEGNVRKLRAYLEEEDDATDVSDKSKSLTREAASKPADHAGKAKTTAAKEASKPVEKKRPRGGEDYVEATPVQKLRKRQTPEGFPEEDSPTFVPATEEKLQKKVTAESGQVVSPHNMRKKGLRLPSKAEVVEPETPRIVPLTGERRRDKGFSSSMKPLSGSKSPAANENRALDSSPASEGGRLTRSGIKKAVHEDVSVTPVHRSKGRVPARKVLMRGSPASDIESSESDDALEAFFEQKGRPLRRSSRHVKEQGNLPHASISDSDADSE